MGAALPGVAMLQQWVGRISSQRPTVSDQVLLDIKHQALVMCNIKLIYLALYWVYVAKLGGGQCCSGSLSESGAALCLTQPVPVAPANAPQRTAKPLRQGDGTSEKIWVRKDKKQGKIGERQSFKHQGKKRRRCFRHGAKISLQGPGEDPLEQVSTLQPCRSPSEQVDVPQKSCSWWRGPTTQQEQRVEERAAEGSC